VKHRLFNVLAGVSLVLCIAAIGFWFRSQSVCENWVYLRTNALSRTYSACYLESKPAFLVLDCGHLLFDDASDAEKYYAFAHEQTPEGFSHFADPTTTGDDFLQRFNEHFWNRLGFVFNHDGSSRIPLIVVATSFGTASRSIWVLTFPWWFIVLMTALPLLVIASRYIQRQRRIRSGLCPTCGYDLRATPDRCPECGIVAQKK
jgi:hypothetical protein